MPLVDLMDRGVESLVLSGMEDIADFSQVSALILVKTFTRHDVDLARRAKAAGVPIYFDLCDNIFIDGYAGKSSRRVQSNFRDICKYANGIVTTGPAMVEQLRPEVGKDIPIWIVPDQVELREQTCQLVESDFWFADPRNLRIEAPPKKRSAQSIAAYALHEVMQSIKEVRKGQFQARRYLAGLDRSSGARHWRHGWRRRFRKILRGCVRYLRKGWYAFYFSLPHRVRDSDFGRLIRHPRVLMWRIRHRLTGARPKVDDVARKTVVWFGHHGSSHGRYGLSVLADLIPDLARANAKVPLRLLVVSDNHSKFLDLFEDTPFPSEFRSWHPVRVYDNIKEADVCVLPNSRDLFSITKSANRAVLALSLGVPVVTTRVPSTDPLEGSVIFDDWEAGVHAYLTDPQLVLAHLAKGQEIIEREFSGRAVGALWVKILGLRPSAHREAVVAPTLPDAKLAAARLG
jgi:glycosyltransferase involved in cell wall biosynthesis